MRFGQPAGGPAGGGKRASVGHQTKIAMEMQRTAAAAGPASTISHSSAVCCAGLTCTRWKLRHEWEINRALGDDARGVSKQNILAVGLVFSSTPGATDRGGPEGTNAAGSQTACYFGGGSRGPLGRRRSMLQPKVYCAQGGEVSKGQPTFVQQSQMFRSLRRVQDCS